MFILIVSDKMIEEMVKQDALTPEHISQLYPFSDRYIIPRNQAYSTSNGVVLFTSEGRHGAYAEADDLENALLSCGLNVVKMEWAECAELFVMIESCLSRLVGNCSLLVVCLMAHGSRGMLRGPIGGTWGQTAPDFTWR